MYITVIFSVFFRCNDYMRLTFYWEVHLNSSVLNRWKIKWKWIHPLTHILSAKLDYIDDGCFTNTLLSRLLLKTHVTEQKRRGKRRKFSNRYIVFWLKATKMSKEVQHYSRFFPGIIRAWPRPNSSATAPFAASHPRINFYLSFHLLWTILLLRDSPSGLRKKLKKMARLIPAGQNNST